MVESSCARGSLAASDARHAHPHRSFARVLMVMSSLGCQRSFDDPSPPNTSLLEARYDEPLGKLSPEGLPESLQRVREQLESVQQTERLGLLQELLQSTARRGDALLHDDRIDDRESARLLVTVQATRVCGVRADASDAQAGFIHMTVRGSRRGIFPIVWGSFERCITPVGPMQVELDGDFWLSLREGPIGRSHLYSFRGSIVTEQSQRELVLDFRLLPDATIEVRVAGTAGDVVFALGSDGGYTARDRVGRWSCELARLRCENTSSGEIVQGVGAP